jgi:hypothetical protein
MESPAVDEMKVGFDGVILKACKMTLPTQNKECTSLQLVS